MNDITHSTPVLRVFEGAEIRQLFEGLLGTDQVRSFDFKWLRAMPRESFTGAHMDAVYMSRGSLNLLTCWIPFGNNPIEMGALAICEGSHKGEAFARLRETYGTMDHERDGLDGSGWFSEDPREVLSLFGGCWKSADFHPGDLLIFSMHTLHMSTTNVTDRVRISADVRWQPAADVVDERYCGNVKEYLQEMSVAGAYSAQSQKRARDAPLADNGSDKPKVTIKQLREAWGYPVAEGIVLK